MENKLSILNGVNQTSYVSPEPSKPNAWGVVLKVIAAAIATLLGALGLQSCVQAF